MRRITSLIGIIGVLALIAGGVLYWVHNYAVLSSKICLWTGFGLVVISLISFLIQQREFFTRRTTKYGVNAAAVILIFLGILVLVNVIGRAHKTQWDLTANKMFSLADQSMKVLDGLEKEVEIYYFQRKETSQGGRMQYLLDLYDYHSDKVSVTTVDPEREPRLAQKYGVKNFGTVVVVAGNRQEKITENPTEEKITNAILRATTGKEKKIYFLAGHQERDLADEYKGINDALIDANFVTDTLLLLREGKIPQDASLLVIAGPKYDYTDSELVKIKEYLDDGGKLLLMLEPGEYPTLSNWLGNFNVKSLNGAVVDVSGVGILFGTSELMPIINQYDKFSPITKEFSAATIFPTVRGFEKVQEGGKYTITELAKTTPQSWLERKYQERKIKFNQDEDIKGPVTIAMTISSTKSKGKETRIALFGDADFVSNSYLGFSGNRDLFLNTVNWLTLKEDLISIRPKTEQDRRINLPANTQRLLFYLIVIVLPFLSLIIGAIVWWRRRV